MRTSRVALVLFAGLVSLASDCDSSKDDFDVESITLASSGSSDQFCEAFGTVFNNGNRECDVTLEFAAFDFRGDRIGTAVDTVDALDPDSRKAYSATFVDDQFATPLRCDEIDRVRLRDVDPDC
jgi:hypothetical protein